MGISSKISNFLNTEFTNCFYPGSRLSIISFLCSVFEIIVCHYVLFSFGHCIACSSIYGSWIYTECQAENVRHNHIFISWKSYLFLQLQGSYNPFPLANHICRLETLFYILVFYIDQIVAYNLQFQFHFEQLWRYLCTLTDSAFWTIEKKITFTAACANENIPKG